MSRRSGVGSNTECLGLDKSTVPNQVARLFNIGLIKEIDEGSVGTHGGRRPLRLAMNRSFGGKVSSGPHGDAGEFRSAR
jgi:hypothetical protein